ncbi:Lipoprotein-releasing system ATP-binding protein LolD [Actinomyces bovis]|uniref:Lipoprotein-releasing system ATP-binding protein LolD n=1 Tax=Actinomyces bovis TaxID=1658 RepID=A0ABY1VPJ3_9ACTO|nr:ABC transporter ATP-binding protein [Actinomyces bovis]SPT53556.1 Lipoprotein-releasing system ATP-binding protein LolD [Actinomyces bovis]VEG55533.1 Lipoprotein-releasing system ATP-binding protein LolD [Actinomyces israelii]
MVEIPPPPARTALLEVEGLSFTYPGKTVLDAVNLTVRAGEAVTVMGVSGSGKSTLLSIILGLLKPTAGTVRVKGATVRGGLGREITRLRRQEIGVVFQDSHLLAALSPLENTILPALVAGTPGPQARERATTLLDELGVGSLERPVDAMSGGEQQRVAIARALINSPSLLLADEPTASLDSGNRQVVMDLLLDQVRRRGCGLLVVSHDQAVADTTDRVLTLEGSHLNGEAS